ncbi:MAG: ABC transporter ATP-binding protein [gamma proteobacterium symbiont of Taylorina sp.]|nr:ABC transporter ATP-binding protein [gamma proteobacterium symbiont of Taylorina sp.]
MCSDLAIKAVRLSKIYPVFDKPVDRLKQFFWKKRQYYKVFTALENVNLELKRGEILGIIGRNGSGKSTLLQLICSTLTPTSGELMVKGRIAALLELGAGFNPEFTGRENIFLNASILGLEQEEIEECYDDIIEFSGIGEFIDQPVKTYSSGMYVRLAFSVAISVDPDILVIDEALSVGDGAFSKKSFDRIMELKQSGKTILFCSHSTYQIEALCNRAIWLDKGQVQLYGQPGDVVVAYNQFLDSINESGRAEKKANNDLIKESTGSTRFTEICLFVNGQKNQPIVISQSSQLSVRASFLSDLNSASPSVGISIFTMDGIVVTSSSSHNDNYVIERDEAGNGTIEVIFPNIPLLKGKYYIDLLLACDQALYLYEHAMHIAEFEVVQNGLEQGFVALQHDWK